MAGPATPTSETPSHGGTPPSVPGPSGWLAFAGLGLLAAGLSLQQVRSFDYWWHLRTGQWIAEHGAVPRVDVYTYTVPGSPWIDIHWLHQLGIYGLYALGGHAGVVVGKLLVVGLWLALLAPQGFRRSRPALSAAALGWMLLVAAERIMPRPELPTFACLAAVLLLLHRFVETPDRRVYAVVGVQLVWVNLHGLFALGIAVCGIYLAAELLAPLLQPGARIDVARARRLAAVTALAALCSLANPNGLAGALYPVEQLGMIGPPEDRGLLGALILELIPPLVGVRELDTLPLALFGGLAAASFAAMGANWRRLHGADPLLWVAFLYLALGAQRNVALFAVVAAPILVRNANAVLDARGPRPARPAAARAASLATALALALFAVDAARGTLFDRLGSIRVAGFGTLDVLYPVAAADWLERHRPPGPLCHHMADGGYLIWRLHPEQKVMVDGRLEVFGEERFLALQVPGSERFRELDAEYGFGSVLLHYSLVDTGDLLRWLYLNTNWRLVSLDDTAALFVRVPAGAISPYPEVDLDDPRSFPPFGAPGPVDRLRRSARTQLLTALGRHEAALALWRETLARYPGLPRGDDVLASLLHRNGFEAASEAILRRLSQQRPQDASLALRIGDLRLAVGDLPRAGAQYDAALALDPRLPWALQRRALVAERQGDPSAAAHFYLRALAQAAPGSSLDALARARLRALGFEDGTPGP